MSPSPQRTSAIAGLAGSLGSCAAAAALWAWVDALRVGLLSEPPLSAAEYARLAAAGGLWLSAPILVTVLLVWLRRSIRRGPPRGSGGGSGAARAPGLPVLAGWAAALVVLAGSSFSVKVGWLAGALLAGVAVFRWVARWARPLHTPRGALTVLLVALVLWAPTWLIPALSGPALSGAASRPEAREGAGAPSFLLVVIDALRADHLGVYGHDRPTSPRIDALARSGVLFTNAAAPSSWTPPSMASILTSTTVGQHGLVAKGQSLPADADEITGRLARAGYRTAAFTTNPWLKSAFGFDQGFGSYYDLDRLGLARRLLGVHLKNLALRRAGRIRIEPELVPEAADITARALGWLRENGQRPFFLYLHYMDVHSPYDAVAPFHGAFCSGHHLGRPDPLLEAEFRRGRHSDDAEVLEHVLELYDEEILATDTAIGRLADGLEELGLDRATMLIVTSDHGEEFLDHGGVMHGRSLYEEVVRVPLIVRPPLREGGPPRVVDERVSTLDLYPTILEMAGLPPRENAAGVSLGPRLRSGQAGSGPRLIGAQLFRAGFSWTALYVGPDKIIRRRRTSREELAASGGEETILELYHLDRDPGERINASGLEPEIATGLSEVVEGYEKSWGVAGIGGARPGEIMDPATLEQLRALGYIN